MEWKKKKKKKKNEKKKKHVMCKRNSPPKGKASTGCVRDTPRIKMKPAQDVQEKLPA